MLGRLAELVPRHASALRAIAERLVDLLPVARAAYYHRDMKGSWSIKKVMPTIDANLSYEHLGEMQEGDGAQAAFLELRGAEVEPERAAALRAELRKAARYWRTKSRPVSDRPGLQGSCYRLRPIRAQSGSRA